MATTKKIVKCKQHAEKVKCKIIEKGGLQLKIATAKKRHNSLVKPTSPTIWKKIEQRRHFE